MNDERKQTELELAEMELELCQNECTDLAKQLEIAQSELIRYIGYKSAAQIEAARAERAEAALDELKILYADRDSDLAFEFNRAETAEAALKQCAEDALAAVPWKALLNIYECLTLPAVALDGDVNTLASFLNQYAPWVPERKE